MVILLVAITLNMKLMEIKTKHQLMNILIRLDHIGVIIINDHKIQGEWKIQLTIAINFMSSKDSHESSTMYS